MSHYARLFDLIEACGPRRILEIGTWDGQHAKQMIETAQRHQERPEDVHYFGFDLFGPAPDYELGKLPVKMNDVYVMLAKTGAQVSLYRGDTRRELPDAMPGLPRMDFIFIDGGHSLETIASDWSHCSRLMHERTVVLLDDYYPDREDAGAKPLVDKLRGDPRYEVLIVEPPTKYPHGLTVNMVEVRCAS